MAALTWRNVDAPNLGASLQGFQQFSQQISQAFAGAKDALSEFDNAKIEDTSNEFMLGLLSKYAETPEQLNADIKSGAVMQGVNAKRLNAQALNLLARRPEDLLRYATGQIQREASEENLIHTQWQNSITKTDRANLDEAKPYMTRMIEAGASSDPEAAMAALRREPGYQEAIGKLDPTIQAAFAKAGPQAAADLLALTTTRKEHRAQDDAHIAAGDQHRAAVFDLGRNQWLFNNEKVEYADQKAGLAVGTTVLSGSMDAASALINLENSPEYQRLSPGAKAVARGTLQQTYGNLYVSSSPEAGGISSGGVVEGFQAGAMPVQGDISSGFGPRSAPIEGASTNHGGIDIRAARGTPVAAPAEGEVIFAARKGNNGNLVQVRHANGVVSSYAHLDSINVKVGQKVSAGAKLGGVGSTGKSTGNHLHYGITVGGKRVDPRTYRWASNTGVEAAASQAQINSGGGAAGGTETWAAGLTDESNAAEVAAALRTGQLANVPLGFLTKKIHDAVNRSKVNGQPTLTYAQAGRLVANSATREQRGRFERFISGDLLDPDGADVNLGNGLSFDTDAFEDGIADARRGGPQDRAAAQQRIAATAAQVENARARVAQTEADYARMMASGRPAVIAANEPRLRAARDAARRTLAMLMAAAGPEVRSNREVEKPAPSIMDLFKIHRER